MSDPWLLQHALEDSAARWPSKLAVVDAAGRHTYADVLARAQAVARALQGSGVGPGERVALFLDNGIDAVAGLYGCWLAAAVAMPINPLTPADKLAALVAATRASALLTQHTLSARWCEAAAAAPTLRGVWAAGRAAADSAPSARPWPAADGAAGETGSATGPDVAGRSTTAAPPAIDRDLATIMHTSGSTGVPKGVMLSHLNMLSAARSVIAYLGLHGGDVLHCALPLSFNYGLYQVLMAFRVGATVVLERGFAFPAASLALMARERCTVFPAVPTMFALLLGLESLDRFDLSALRLVTNAAAALPDEHLRRLRARLPQAQLYSMYGQTECTRITFLPPEQLDLRPGSVGRGMPNEALWLVDDEGRRLPSGGTDAMGELVVRGSHVMLGYWERPEETAQRLKPGPLPGEQVLHTGDLFRTDGEGWLYFVARRDDIIKSRGEKVSPREVENAIHTLPGVHEAAVVGVPDALLGQAVKAFIVCRDGARFSERDVIRHCQARLESFMVPRHVEFVPELPKTLNGKVRKASLVPPT